MPFPVTTTTQVLSIDKNLIQSRVRDVLGISTSGYGISALESSLHSTGTRIRSSDFTDLYNDLDRAYEHQTDNNLMVIDFSSGTVITTSSINYLNTISEYIVTNRYTVHPNQTIEVVDLTDPRETIWESKILTSVLCTWTSALQADYFFNCGGVLKLDTVHLNNWFTPYEREWARLIDSIGTFTFNRALWITGQNTSTTYTANSPYTFTATVSSELSEKSVRFIVALSNSAEQLLVYPDNLVYSVQDGTIVEPALSTTIDTLQDIVFTATSGASLVINPYIVGFDLKQT